MLRTPLQIAIRRIPLGARSSIFRYATKLVLCNAENREKADGIWVICLIGMGRKARIRLIDKAERKAQDCSEGV
jgi:hypothetical protein